MTDQVIVQARDRLHIIGPGSILTTDQVDAADATWADNIVAELARPDHAVLVGRYVQADLPNRNGHAFSVADLRAKHTTIHYTPYNMLHNRQHTIGTYVATALRDPDPSIPGMDAPWVDAVTAMWRFVYPDDYRRLVKAHDDGALYHSMEAVGRTMTCGDPTGCCGETFPFRGAYHDTYCDTVNSGVHGIIGDPLFVGGAAILPPTRPGWGGADVRIAAALIDRHETVAADLHAMLESATNLDGNDIDELVAAILAGVFTTSGEPPVEANAQIGWYVPPFGWSSASNTTTFSASIPEAADTVAEAAAGERGVAVVVQPPAHIRDQIVLADGLPVEELHVTLAMLGDVHIPDGIVTPTPDLLVVQGPGSAVYGERITEVVDAIATYAEPVVARFIAEPTTFPLDDAGNQALVALVDAPGLNELRATLVKTFESWGVSVAMNHGFTPHLTLAHLAPGAARPDITLPTDPWPITALHCWFGNLVRSTYLFRPELDMPDLADAALLVPADTWPDGDVAEARKFSREKRMELAKKGWALSDGSYPIETVADLKNAISAYGRAPESHRAALRALIRKRARALGVPELIPDSWD